MYQLCEMVYFEIPFKDRRFRHAEPNPCTCSSTFPKSGVFAFDLLYRFFVLFWVLKMNPSSWLSSRPCPRSRSWSFARNETRHGPWSLCSLAAVFFGQVSRDMRFARIMTSERPERASTPSSILYPAPAPTATLSKHHKNKQKRTTNHHIIINNSNSIPVQKHMHRFSTEAYNKKPHQNSTNLGNVKKMFTILKKSDDGVKLHGVVLAHSLL